MNMERMPPFESSNLEEVEYDHDTEVLTVTFKRGAKYDYRGVPFDVWMKFCKAVSKGEYFSAHIRNDYPAGRVN